MARSAVYLHSGRPSRSRVAVGIVLATNCSGTTGGQWGTPPLLALRVLSVERPVRSCRWCVNRILLLRRPGCRATQSCLLRLYLCAARLCPERVWVRRRSIPTPPSKLRWRRYVALGDSLTEGLCDRSRMPDGVYRGWADRLALLLALAEGTCGRAGEGNNPGAGVVSGGIEYANLAVRSRRVRDVVETQVPRAMELGADLVSILIGANDLVRAGNDPVQRAALLCDSVAVLRGSGCDVLLVTPFYPLRPVSRWFTARFAAFNRVLRDCAADTGALLLDVAADPVLVGTDRWAEDRVHLNPAGHRGLAYAAAEVLGVPDAQLLAGLERAIHASSGEDASTVVGDLVWFRRYAMPWIARRVRGRTAGEGMVAKDDTVMSVTVPPMSVAVMSSAPSTVVRASGGR